VRRNVAAVIRDRVPQALGGTTNGGRTMRERVLHMASFKQAVAALSISFVGCSSPAPDPAAETAWGAATVVEELSIGVESGPDEYMFGSIRGIAVGAEGVIYVADGRPTIVRTYDSDGVFLRDIGRQGQGPGEFVSAPGLGVLPSGMLVTRDPRGSRVSFFSSGGEYLDSFPVVPGVRTLIIDREGNIYVQLFEGDVELVKYSIEGEELGRVTFPPQDMAGASTFVLGSGEGGIFPFPTETRSAWSPLAYLVTGRNDVYDIELRKPEGTVHLTREVAPVPVGGEEHAEWEAFRQTLVERARARSRDTEYEPIPEVKPFFRQLYVGEDGRIWVFRYVAAEKRDDIEPLPDRPERPLLTWREPWTYDVFDPDGTFLGSVVVPDGLQPFVFRGEQIWGSLTDDDGVERVVRLRVLPRVRRGR